MRGSVANQVYVVFKTVIKFGSSKHQAKAEARSAGAATWHSIGKSIEIYSYSTADAYRDVAKQIFSYAKENFSVRDITKLEAVHVQSFLEHKIEQGIKYSTFQQYAAAAEKLEVALSRYTCKNYNFDLPEVRELAQNVLEKTDSHRAYSDPKGLINAVSGSTYKVLAQAQYEGGFRVHELNYLTFLQFKENGIEVKGKGGKIRTIELPQSTYNALKTLVENSPDKKLIFSPDIYRKELKTAAVNSMQTYNGTHGLRWSYAQNTFRALQKEGRSYEESLLIVSQLLGHERADITEHYLK